MSWAASFDQHVLSVLTFSPLAAAAVAFLLPTRLQKVWALVATLAIFVGSVVMANGVSLTGTPEFVLVERYNWIPALGISYSLGMDGISLWLVLLTTFLMPIVVLGAWGSVSQKEKGFYTLLLVLECGMLGAFVSLDVFLFYVFWEAMLIPMYFLIGVWGGKDRTYAAMKFFLFTLVGSLLMLVAIFYIAHQHQVQFGNFSTSVLDFYRVKIDGGGWFSPQSLLFLAFALAFAIKVPLFPLHTWLPDAHVQAPTAGSVILAGVLLKMGGYGFLRFAFPMFPNAVDLYQPVFMALGAIAIVYGAWVAMVQPDLKKLVAYSSVSHMGYVVLGLFALNSIGVTGSVVQMLNHGISTGALFLLVGMVYDRRHTREISDFGGIAKRMPLFAVAFVIMTLSSVALPGTNGFIGEFMILLGSFQASPGWTVVAATGVVFGAVYMLWALERVMFGKVTHEENNTLQDLSVREMLVLSPLLVAVFWIGLAPGTITSSLEPSIKKVLERAKGVNT